MERYRVYYKGNQGRATLTMSTKSSTKLIKLKETTFTLYGSPSTTLVNSLTWCNKVPKGKRNKPSKINGIQHHEISESVEHTYYQPLH